MLNVGFFFLGKKVEDLIKVQLSWTKDEERVLIENRLTPKPMYVFFNCYS